MKKIDLKKVKVHNLKEVDLSLESQKLIIFTGVSGSGKSSLAFDTIYVEGQRRYVESLSSYAKRFLGDLTKPEAESITGISPTIAIEQKTVSKNPRSTVGTLTGIYDFMRVLFARIGTPYCPISQEPISFQSRDHIFHEVMKHTPAKGIFLSPYIQGKKGELKDVFEDLLRKGFMKIRLGKEIYDLSEEISLDKSKHHDIDIVIDRVVIEENNRSRIKEAITSSLDLGSGLMTLLIQTDNKEEEILFSEFAYSKKSKTSYPPLEPQDFSFNHPKGMCSACEGLGQTLDFDFDKIIDPKLSIKEGAVSIAGSYNTVRWGNIYDNLARLYKFSVDTPWEDLPKKNKDIFLNGVDKKWIKMRFVHPEKGNTWTDYVSWKGVIFEAKKRYADAKSDLYKANVEKLMSRLPCSACNQARIKPYPAACRLNGKTIKDLISMPLHDLLAFFENYALTNEEERIGSALIQEIKKRIAFLLNVGLFYLSIDRLSPSLSGGEAQRVRLASQIGSGLVGTTYILDEPSIGLHPRDNEKLIGTLKELRDKGNTVIVVEHDEGMMLQADQIVDVGPFAGVNGGEIISSGSLQDLVKNPKSLTGAYLCGKKSLPTFAKRVDAAKHTLTITGATLHNLKKVSLTLPLQKFIAITGVSGSGKSSLISQTLVPALLNELHDSRHKVGPYSEILGLEHIDKVISIDQSPIGRTPRSNPSTYIKVFDDIRNLFSSLPESKTNGFTVGRFSFNVKEGSCPNCSGMGQIRVDMDFMEDVWLSCPQCNGKRFDPKTLSILYKGKNINDVLEMSVEEAQSFFEATPPIRHKLDILLKVGLSYVTLGQSSVTLSGGEAQRIKLAKEIIRRDTGKTLYVFDEPTTGLHIHDIAKLLEILQELVERKNTVLVIEHQMDLVKAADYVIDIGPEGGFQGGKIMFEGTPENLSKKRSPTGIALKEAFAPKKIKPATISHDAEKKVTTIEVTNACQNNLQNVSLSLPRDKITVCTGPSGSGKSSFAFDTIFAEGQRRYIESLSSYAKQFIKPMEKSKVEKIEGLSPSVAIEQKKHAGNPRSTVGTMTEIYDYLRILYANLGVAYCPDTGEKIESISTRYVVNHLQTMRQGAKFYILSKVELHNIPFEDVIESLQRQGFLRIRLNKAYYELDDQIPYQKEKKNELFLVIDRVVLQPKIEKRLFEAVERAASFSRDCFVVDIDGKDHLYNLSFAVKKTGKTYPKITPHTFSFNADDGMCNDCLGLGYVLGANLLSFPKILKMTPVSIVEKLWKDYLTDDAIELFFSILHLFDIDSKTKIKDLSEEKLQILFKGAPQDNWVDFDGCKYRWIGLNHFFEKAAKSNNRMLKDRLQPFLKKTTCNTCQGERLHPLARKVEIDKVTLPKLCQMSILETNSFVSRLKAPKEMEHVLEEVLTQLKNRLRFLIDIGIEYLSLDRAAPTLSGGETQRIHLAKQIGSQITGALYVLDEPSIGLHPHNNQKLNEALRKLCNLGNTLILVEHDPLTIEASDHIIDFGPKAGSHGGKVIAEGSFQEIKENPASLTGRYLSGKTEISIPKKTRPFKDTVTLQNASINNLKGISVEIPTKNFVCITGLSGSGKSSLMHQLLKPMMQLSLASRDRESPIEYLGATLANHDQWNKMIAIDQNPIGTTNRANVCTYSELLTPLRQFFSSMPLAKTKGLKPYHFSYNHKRGMCKTCYGLGYKSIYLQYMPPVKTKCDACKGNRLNPLSLEVTYKGKNLGQYLDITVEDAKQMLPPIPKLLKSLQSLIDVGLGYLKLGQDIATLSGGEAQRLRLSRELAKRSTGKTLYIFDEPTIGLHFEDIEKLLPIFHSLVDKGNTLIIIEHNQNMIANADYIIDLGPDAGYGGGEVVATGTPKDIIQNKNSYTGKYLQAIL